MSTVESLPHASPNDVFGMVSQVYQHLTLMLEHNRGVICERNQRLQALKARRNELIWREQQRQQQQQHSSLIPPPPPGPSTGLGTTNSAWLYQQPGHTMYGTQVSAPCTPSHLIPPPQATSTPYGPNQAGRGQPPANSTGYLTFSDDTGSSGRGAGANCARPPAGPTKSKSTVSVPVQTNSKTCIPPQRPPPNHPTQRGATEGNTGFQVLYCPDCNAKLGIIFEIFHLDGCASANGNRQSAN